LCFPICLRKQFFSSEEAGEEHRTEKAAVQGIHLAAVHSRPAEVGNHPAAEEGLRIAAGEGNLAVDRIRLAADRSLEGRREVGRTGSGHRSRLAEEEHRIREPHPGDGSTFRPWCRTRDQLHRGSA
jgi:hypothetical protein